MNKLSAAASLEKNKLCSDGAYLVLLELTIPALPEPILLVRNTEDITWRGKTWTAFPFELSDVKQTSDGEIPELNLQVSNVNRIMQSYVEQAHGGVDSSVRLYVINSNLLTDSNPLLEEFFSVTKVSCNEEYVSISLGVGYGKTRRPLLRYLKDFCQSTYGSCKCGVSKEEMSKYPDCPHTLVACRARNNSGRFGACPLIGAGGLYL